MNTFALILTGILGAICTFYINNTLKQGAVRASAGLSLVIAVLFYIFPNVFSPYLTRHIPVVFIGATFIGMVSSDVLGHYLLLSLAGALFAILYIHSSNFFNGYGGALGTTASITVLVAISLAMVSKHKYIRRLRKRK
tara:strand:+ start:144 stop:557 length:414 start_codon:yes stop_codon:yes gene_type:complete